MLDVIAKHRSYAHKIDSAYVPLELLSAARAVWDEAYTAGTAHGFRNSQVTVLAPTGTIAFMMDCDTTGVEPDIALVKYKKLVGGGMLKIVNNTVPRALRRLGYESKDIQSIVEYIDEHDTIEGAPELKDEHLPVFDCAFKAAQGHARHPSARPPAHDGRGAAVHLRRHLQDHQHAERRDRGRHHGGLHRGLAPRREGGCHLPRRLQTHAAAEHGATREEEPGARTRVPPRAPAPAAGLPLAAPQIRYRRTRGLHPRRAVRRRHAGRAVHQDRQGGQYHRRA